MSRTKKRHSLSGVFCEFWSGKLDSHLVSNQLKSKVFLSFQSRKRLNSGLVFWVFQERKRSNSKQGYWILPKANGRTIIKLAVSFLQDQQGISPPKRRPNVPTSPRLPVNSQPTNIGHRRQFFGLVDHEQMFWSPLPCWR